jgi:hypothetical protein
VERDPQGAADERILDVLEDVLGYDWILHINPQLA